MIDSDKSKLNELKTQILQTLHEIAHGLQQKLASLEQRCKAAEESSQAALLILNKIIPEMEELVKEMDTDGAN